MKNFTLLGVVGNDPVPASVLNDLIPTSVKG